MNNPAIISPQKGKKNFSDHIFGVGRPEARKSTSERNDNPVSRFFALSAQGKKPRQAAINAMCAHCMGCTAKEQGFREEDWIEPGFREQIRNCSSSHCPLWTFRPFQGGAK